ncbi:MAG TPA: tRNA (adenosine(37)-N6)-dimethylallyltransferase MiaA [Bacteriovoracaceae bacterium]|nr:tRNA (adenosine(37)-N6)-dimethylallyltransferase MiaA [Bacteriovoracaceae bacterium]
MKVIIVSGPTACGKTKISIELAKKFNAEVVNFDSLLLYKEISIGTAKPTPHEMDGVVHHMIDVATISDPLNASSYAELALPIVNEIHARGKNVILTGGSGFYLQALLKGMYDSPTTPKEILQRSEDLYRREGITPFLEILKISDLESFKRYHENDHYRIRRAVEHFWTHGTPLSELRVSKDQENQTLKDGNIHGWKLCHIYLNIPRDEHLEIIRVRTQHMLQEGLLDEVRGLLHSGFTGAEKPLQSIGYKESLDYLAGKITSIEELIEKITISTRQLAKSQRTWFNREKEKLEFHPLSQRNEIFERVGEFLK